MFGTVWGGGWVNENCVRLDPEKRILGRPSAWLIEVRLIVGLSTPLSEGVDT